MKLSLPHHALAIAGLGIVALVTLPGATGLLGEVYRVDGGAASAAAVHTSTPTPVSGLNARPTLTPTASTPTVEPAVSATEVPLDSRATPATTRTASTPTPATTTPGATTTAPPNAPTALSTRPSLSSTALPPTATSSVAPRTTSTTAPTATATPTSSPTPTSTPDACLIADAFLGFPTAELKLRTSGQGATKLQLENQGKRTARDIRLTVTAVQGRERLVALAIGETKWELSSEKQLSLSIRELAGGASTTLGLAYEVDFTQRDNDTLAKAAVAPVELRIEVAGEACPRVIKAEVPSMRVLIEPEIRPVVPAATKEPVNTGVKASPQAVEPVELVR